MKKFVCFLVLVSCSKDDSPNGLEANKKLLVGEWLLVSEFSYNSSEAVLGEKSLKASEICPFDVLNLVNDGSLIYTSYAVEDIEELVCEEKTNGRIGKWILQGERRLGINNEGEVSYYTIIEVNNTSLVLERILTKTEVIFGGYPSEVTKIRIFYKR